MLRACWVLAGTVDWKVEVDVGSCDSDSWRRGFFLSARLSFALHFALMFISPHILASSASRSSSAELMSLLFISSTISCKVSPSAFTGRTPWRPQHQEFPPRVSRRAVSAPLSMATRSRRRKQANKETPCALCLHVNPSMRPFSSARRCRRCQQLALWPVRKKSAAGSVAGSVTGSGRPRGRFGDRFGFGDRFKIEPLQSEPVITIPQHGHYYGAQTGGVLGRMVKVG